MAVTLLLLALGVICCFATFRWTRGLPISRRRLIRSLSLSLLCPLFLIQENELALSPPIFYLAFGGLDLKPEMIEKLVLQILLAWALIYFISLAMAGICPPPSDNPAKRRQLKLITVIGSLPSWVLIAGLVCYRGFICYQVWLGEKNWPFLNFLTVICFICLICSLAAMTLVLISMGDHSIHRSDVFLLLWATLPIALGMLIGFSWWCSINFGDGGMEDYCG